MTAELASTEKETGPTPWAAVGLFAIGFAAAMIAVNAWVARLDAPHFAVWTGVAPFETKLERLEEFVEEDDSPYGLLFGNSYIDFGLAAEEMRPVTKDGTELRMFNMAAGGARNTWILEDLYRLARLKSHPKAIFVYLRQAKLDEASQRARAEPDATMGRNPVNTALSSDWLLPWHAALFAIPMVHDAPAVRSLLLHGEVKDKPAVPDYSAVCDRVTFLGALDPEAAAEALAVQQRQHVGTWKSIPDDLGGEALARAIYGDQVDGLRRFKKRTDADGAELVLVLSAPSLLWNADDEDVRRQRSRALRALGETVGVRVLDLPSVMKPAAYEVGDTVHMNHLAAVRAAQAATALSKGETYTEELPRAYFADGAGLDLEAFREGRLPMIVLAPRGTPFTLKVEILRGLPDGTVPENFFLTIVLPDGTRVSRPIRRLTPTTFEADFDGLELERDSALILFVETRLPDGTMSPYAVFIHSFDVRPLEP